MIFRVIEMHFLFCLFAIMVPATFLALTLIFGATTENLSFMIAFYKSISATFEFTFVQTLFANFTCRDNVSIIEIKIGITARAF